MGQEIGAKGGDDGLTFFFCPAAISHGGAREEVFFHRCLGSQYRFVGLDKALTAF